MDRRRSGGLGLTAAIAGLVSGAIAGWIASAEAPSLPFAIAQGVLLGGALVGGLGAFVDGRPFR